MNISNERLSAAIKASDLKDDFITVEIDDCEIHDLARINHRYWFEYHCNESHDSADAKVWYHSHQQCLVLGFANCDPVAASTFEERAECAVQLLYRVRFDDGLEWDVFEDELMLSRDQFQRPDPPQSPE